MAMVKIASFMLAARLVFGQSGTIEGRVLTGGGGSLACARVTLRVPITGARVFAAEAGDDGSFAFPGLKGARYTIRIERAGYVLPETDPGLVKTLWLAPGQALKDLEFRM